MGGLGLSKPGNSLSMLPFTLSLSLVISIMVNAGSVHHIILELTRVFVSIGHVFNTVSVSFMIFEIPFILALIRPRHLTFAMHLIILKVAFISLARISEVILALSMETTIKEVTIIDIAGTIRKLTLSSLPSLFECASI